MKFSGYKAMEGGVAVATLTDINAADGNSYKSFVNYGRVSTLDYKWYNVI